jgi:hypothetical protein
VLEYWFAVAIRITPLLQHSIAEIAGVAELADALDSKSSGRKVVWVRAPPPAMNSQSIFDV